MERRQFISLTSGLVLAQFIPSFIRSAFAASSSADPMHMLLVTYGERIATEDDDKKSELARSIFDNWKQPQPGEPFPYVQIDHALLAQQMAMKDIRSLDVMQAADMAKTIGPMLHYLDGAYAQVAELSNPASASVIESGREGVFNFNGFCMDPAMGAPHANTPLRLFDISRLSGPQYAPYFRALATSLDTHSSDAQSIIWALREALRNKFSAQSYANGNMPNDVRAALNKAMPNGANKLMGQIKADLHANAIPDYDQYQKVADRLAGQGKLQSGHETPYTLMRPGVAAFTMGTADLAGRTGIVNQSAQPYIFEPGRYVAENSQRATQRVVMNSSKPLVSNGSVNGAMGAWNAMRDDLTGFGKDKSMDYLPHKMSPLLLGDAIESDVMDGVLKATPVIGNALSAYEAITGKPWNSLYTDQYTELSPAERLFSATSSIPGYGNLMRIAGKAAPTIYAGLAHAVESNGFKGAEFLATTNTGNYVMDKINNGTPELKRSYDQMQASVERAYKDYIG